MKNLKKKALVPAIAMVLASVIALSGVTYAWFTTGTTADVKAMDVNVATANGIQVSLDGVSWKSTITSTDIINAISGVVSTYPGRLIQYPRAVAGDGQAAVEISPVSSAGNVKDGKMEMFYGAYNQGGNLDSIAEVEDNRSDGGNFIAFDLFFKTSSAQDLYLITGNGSSSVSCVNLSGGDTDMGTEKAVRVAFIPMGTSGTVAGIQGKKMAEGKAIIWEPNSDSHVDTSISGAVAYKGFTKAFTDVAEGALSANEVEDVKPIYSAQLNDPNSVIISMNETYSKVRVYIWLEGQDIDCVNSISNGDFSVALQFGVNPPEETTTESTAPEGGEG